MPPFRPGQDGFQLARRRQQAPQGLVVERAYPLVDARGVQYPPAPPLFEVAGVPQPDELAADGLPGQPGDHRQVAQADGLRFPAGRRGVPARRARRHQPGQPQVGDQPEKDQGFGIHVEFAHRSQQVIDEVPVHDEAEGGERPVVAGVAFLPSGLPILGGIAAVRRRGGAAFG